MPLRVFLGISGWAQWNIRGISYDDILPGVTIHPEYGCYFPTKNRTAHLQLFRDWLRKQDPTAKEEEDVRRSSKGEGEMDVESVQPATKIVAVPKKAVVETSSISELHEDTKETKPKQHGGPRYRKALDVGTGSGILSALMLSQKAVVGRVHAIDVSLPAVKTARQTIKSMGKGLFGRFSTSNVGLKEYADEILQSTSSIPPQYDLICFNPPWLVDSDVEGIPPTNPSMESPLQGVFSSDDQVVNHFFNTLIPAIAKPDAKVVVLTSDFSEIGGLVDKCPIVKAIQECEHVEVTNVFSSHAHPHLHQPQQQGNDRNNTGKHKPKGWWHKLKEQEVVSLVEMRVLPRNISE